MSVSSIRKNGLRQTSINDKDGVLSERHHIRKDAVNLIFGEVLHDIDADKEIVLDLRPSRVGRNCRIIAGDFWHTEIFEQIGQSASATPIIEDRLWLYPIHVREDEVGFLQPGGTIFLFRMDMSVLLN